MKVEQLIDEIKQNKAYCTKSTKDEIRVMKAILNDKDYEVTIYDKTGAIGTYNPSKEFRKMITSVMINSNALEEEYAEKVVDKYKFSNKEAETMVGFSKQFINTYIETNRKINLGGREKSNISFYKKEVKPFTISSPNIVTTPDGKKEYKEPFITNVPAYTTIKVDSGCPEWLKNDK